jgi:nucleotide-binding universal stress UspA family protein
MTTTQRFRIVIALDRSEYAEIVLEHGLDQAARHDAPDIHFITIADETDPTLDPTKEWLATSVLEGLDSFATDRVDWRTRLHVRRGRPAEQIAELAGEVEADLLVVGRFGAHGRHGSTADRVLALAPCPTLVVGLTGRVGADAQCPDCVAARAASGGDRWFCAAHSAPDRHRLTALLPGGGSLSHGGPLW